jgi:hypothetical protein
MKYYLTHGSTPHYLDPKKKRALRLKSTQYQLIQGILCRKNYDGVFLRCLEKRDIEKFCPSSMMDLQEDITVEILLHTKSSELDITSPLYSNIPMRMQGDANNVKSQQ